jgi:hypothetical protein
MLAHICDQEVPCPWPQVCRFAPGEDSTLGNFADSATDYAKVGNQPSLLTGGAISVSAAVSRPEAQGHVRLREEVKLCGGELPRQLWKSVDCSSAPFDDPLVDRTYEDEHVSQGREVILFLYTPPRSSLSIKIHVLGFWQLLIEESTDYAWRRGSASPRAASGRARGVQSSGPHALRRRAADPSPTAGTGDQEPLSSAA